MFFIVQCGLTRRLVEADDEVDARLKYIHDVPIRRFLTDGSDEILDVHVATEDEIRDFQKRRRVEHIEGQEQWDLNDVRKEAQPSRRSNKEPA